MANSQRQSSVTVEAVTPSNQPPPSPLETIELVHLKFLPGESHYQMADTHTLFVNLTPQPIQYLQAQDEQTFSGLYRHGDMLITPAKVPLFVRWEKPENCLQIRLSDRLLKSVAEDTSRGDCDRLTLRPTFQSRQTEIEAIATLLLSDLRQPQPNGSLYRDSLANVLAIQLLRNYGDTRPQLVTYEGGLPYHQLSSVLDYIDAYLHRDIKLAELAQMLDMSPFHFGRMFKQSLGITPHQYLIQQRVERAKQLLKHSKQSIIDIALACGFNSHSHLSRQFRQVTGMPPKVYRQQN